MSSCKGNCGKQLPAWFQGERCDACKQRKYRDKRMAVQRAYAMGFEIDKWNKMLTEGTIDASHGRELLHAVWDRLSDFYKNIQDAEAKQQAKADEHL